jgi:transcriptional regulator with XRE-family HTH domain
MNMPEKIDLLSQKKGIKNRRQLAEFTGIPYTTLDGLYKKGHEGIRLPTLRTLAHFFGVSMEYLSNDALTVPLPPEDWRIGGKQKELMDLASVLDEGECEQLLELYRILRRARAE